MINSLECDKITVAALQDFSTAVFQTTDHGEYFLTSCNYFRLDNCQVGCLGRGERGEEPGSRSWTTLGKEARDTIWGNKTKFPVLSVFCRRALGMTYFIVEFGRLLNSLCFNCQRGSSKGSLQEDCSSYSNRTLCGAVGERSFPQTSSWISLLQ